MDCFTAFVSGDSHPSRRIFISYRRGDSSGHVRALLQPLHRRFGRTQIFMDIDSIEGGEDFVDALQRELSSCRVMLVIIGREWLTAEDPRLKTPRLDNPEDFVRLEVATALRNEQVRVVPVLVEGAAMPPSEELPEDLRPLARRHAVELSESRWDADIARLLQVIGHARGDAFWKSRRFRQLRSPASALPRRSSSRSPGPS
jgi:hypothetical protein